VEFTYTGGCLGKGGQVTLYGYGEKVGEGAVAMTQAMVFSADVSVEQFLEKLLKIIF
jgi:hypothetical protein